MDFDLSEAPLLGSLAAKQKFLGCSSSTSELKDTVAEMFYGIDIVVASVDGKPEEPTSTDYWGHSKKTRSSKLFHQ